MNQEKKVEETISQYATLGEENKNIDMAALMVSALEQARRDEVEAKKKRNAYLVSICLPPLGLFYAVRWYFSGKDDGKRVAVMCAVLTATVLLIVWGIGRIFVSTVPAGTTDQLQQVKDINVNDLQDLLK
jgi:hypothetical protein